MSPTPETFRLGNGAVVINFIPYRYLKSPSLGTIEVTGTDDATAKYIKNEIIKRLHATKKTFGEGITPEGKISLSTAVVVRDPGNPPPFLTRDDIRTVLSAMAEELSDPGTLSLAAAAGEASDTYRAKVRGEAFDKKQIQPYLDAVTQYLKEQGIKITHEQWHGLQDALAAVYRQQQDKLRGS